LLEEKSVTAPEITHYFDVNHDGTLAVENAGKHGHTLFGKGLRQVASAAPT
jgi:hypothetical protein